MEDAGPAITLACAPVTSENGPVNGVVVVQSDLPFANTPAHTSEDFSNSPDLLNASPPQSSDIPISAVQSELLNEIAYLLGSRFGFPLDDEDMAWHLHREADMGPRLLLLEDPAVIVKLEKARLDYFWTEAGLLGSSVFAFALLAATSLLVFHRLNNEGKLVAGNQICASACYIFICTARVGCSTLLHLLETCTASVLCPAGVRRAHRHAKFCRTIAHGFLNTVSLSLLLSGTLFLALPDSIGCKASPVMIAVAMCWVLSLVGIISAVVSYCGCACAYDNPRRCLLWTPAFFQALGVACGLLS
jgi:hypothetical protein